MGGVGESSGFEASRGGLLPSLVETLHDSEDTTANQSRRRDGRRLYDHTVNRPSRPPNFEREV